jgi:hypothetical protein
VQVPADVLAKRPRGEEEGEEEGEEHEGEMDEVEGEEVDGEEEDEEHEEEEGAPQAFWRRPTGRGPVGKEWDTSIGAPLLHGIPARALMMRPGSLAHTLTSRCGSDVCGRA